jgi:hypothetical protein
MQSACQTTGVGGATYVCNKGWRAPPPQPNNIDADDGISTSKIDVDWAGELPLGAKFRVFRSALGQLCADSDQILETGLTQTSDTQVIPGVTYTYSVSSKAPNGSSSTCFTENTGTGYRKISPPTNMQAELMNQSWVHVLWNHPVQQPANGVVKYRLYRREGNSASVCSAGQQIATLNGSDSSYFDVTVVAGKTYYYAVRSEGANGFLSDCSGASSAAGIPGYSVSGKVTKAGTGAPMAGVVVSANGTTSVTTDSAGNYSITNLANGTYSVAPLLSGVVVTPANQSVTLSGSSKSDINFQASCAPGFSFNGNTCVPNLVSPIQPLLECVIEQPQGGLIALFRYQSQNSASYEIPLGTSALGVNSFSPAPQGRGQPVVFLPGLAADAFAVPFDGTPLTWTVAAGSNAPLTATASSASPRCLPVVPTATCVSIAQGGMLQAHFGYVNPNQVSIPAAVGAQNFISPAPENRGQPSLFAPGTNVMALSADFSGSSLTWNLFGTSATVSNATTVCSPGNSAPQASAGISYEKACTGAPTQLSLSALSSFDPNGNTLFYSWSTTCANASFDNAQSATPQLILMGPGLGSPANCSVTVTVSDLLASSSASAPVSVTACTLDCAGVPGGAGSFDQCGVCNGDGTSCLDCLGVPHGSTIKDQCGVCGGTNACLDCNGVPNGTAVRDRCGACNGDGLSCLGCTATNIANLTGVVSDDFFTLRDLTNRALRRLRDVSRADKKTNKWVRKQLKKYDFRHNKFGLDLYAKLPPTIVSCSNVDFCVAVDNGALLDSYRAYAGELEISGHEAVKRLKKFTVVTNTDKKRKKRLTEVKGVVIDGLNKIPREGSQCS